MSFALDANILLYASDDGNPLCLRAKTLLEGCVSSGNVFFLAWPTVMAYLRIATHPRVFDHPLSQLEAVANVEMLLTCPHVRMLGEEEGFWQAYRETTDGVPTRGNLVPDAHLATILRQHGVNTIYTRDRDFRKFPQLRVVDPFV